ncbi:MAG TPA: type II toxin-antitoxin system prevent-host-death family antitoxin [Acetobacteraceae bacterium]|nr:type II toxin-antitoxin system prevent-host-death family antitoxin [Acetobacteraceae bacterium]
MTMQSVVEEQDANLAELLDRVERGEEVTIARSGRPVARMTPAPAVAYDVASARAAVQAIFDLREELRREGVAPITLEELLAARHEGHKY